MCIWQFKTTGKELNLWRGFSKVLQQCNTGICVSHLVCEERPEAPFDTENYVGWAFPGTHRHWHQSFSSFAELCHFMLWEQCNGVLKGWEYPGSERINGKKMHYCLAWDKNQAWTWGKRGSPLYLLSSAAALAVSCTANPPWFGIKPRQSSWELGAAGPVPGCCVSVTQVCTVLFQLRTRQKFYSILLSYLNMNWI